MNPKEIAYEALAEMYQEAEPPLDFQDVIENPDNYPDDWFDHHELPLEQQEKIVSKHMEDHNLTKLEKSRIHMTATLQLGPASPEDGGNDD